MSDDTKRDDGGPAFPMAYHAVTGSANGMKLRDWFAGQVAAGCFGLEMPIDKKAAAEFIYQLADALLEARKR